MSNRATRGGISAPFIRHPVATAMLMIGLLLIGLIGYRHADRLLAGNQPADH